MKPLRSILTAGLALAVISTSARAETFPIFEDAAGSTVTNVITRAAGSAKTLGVSARSNAYINFSVSSSGIDPATVTAARLIIFTPRASVAGTLSIKALTSGFTETITTRTIPAPTIGATLDTIDLAQIPLKGDFFISDITAQVKAWLADPATEFGIAITSDGTASCLLASKEGAASGHPAIIEVDVNRGGGTVAGTSGTFDSLGVGTSSPEDLLQVAGTAGTRLLISTTAASFAGVRTRSANHEYFVGISSNSNDFIVQDNTNAATRLRILANGDFGIGTNTPAAPLDVSRPSDGHTLRLNNTSGENGIAGISMINNGTFMGQIGYVGTTNQFGFAGGGDVIFGSYNGADLRFDASPDGFEAQRMFIQASTGRVGIGTDAPEGTLQIAHAVNAAAGNDFPFLITKQGGGDILLMRTFSAGGAFNLELFEGDAFKPGGGAWGVVSDRRLKKDIEPLDGALDHLLKLRSVTYEYIDPAKSHQFAGTQTGFIAQEVETVFPEWVTENADGYKAVTIRGFESLTVQALRELRQEKETEIAALKAANTALAAKLATLEARDREREARLARIESALDDRPARTVRASLDSK